MARLLIIEDGVPLASLLVSATSARGHLTTAAHSGREGLTLAREEPFALAVVDLLLPDLRGAEVLETLRGLGVPCIAMSGVFKGDRFAKDAVEQHGARAFFEKPFVLNDLLDTIDGIVGAQPGVRLTPGEDDGQDEFDIELDEESGVLELRADDIVDDELTPRSATPYLPAADEDAGRAATPVVAAAALEGPAPTTSPVHSAEAEISFADLLDDGPPVPSSSPPGPSSSPPGPEVASPPLAEPSPSDDELSFGDLFDEGRSVPTGEGATSPPLTEPPGDDGSFDGLLAALEPQDLPSPPSMDDADQASDAGLQRPLEPATPFSERGQVWSAPTPAAAALPERPQGASLGPAALVGLLTACHQSRFTGSLELSADGDDLSLRFHAGRVVGALTSRPEGSFTLRCLEHGALALDRKAEVDALVFAESLAPEDAMQRLGLIEPELRARLVAGHVRSLVQRALSWPSGTSRLVTKEPQPGESVSPSLTVPELLFEGILATADPEVLREALPDSMRLTPTADPPYELGELPMGDAQAYVLAHTDGSKSIADLRVLSDMEEDTLRATLHAMLQLGILEVRTVERSSRRITFGL